MRSSLPITLVSLLLPSLAVSTLARSACLREVSDGIADAAACGDKNLLRKCFAKASGLVPRVTVEACFVKAGCSPRGAENEANWVIQFCDGDAEELRKRRPEPIPGPTPIPEAFPQGAATTAPAATTPLVCFTQSMTEIQTCASTNKYQCSSTTVPTLVCAAGLLCLHDKVGNALCMKREDGLTTSGAIVAIFLAVVMTLTVTAIVFLCCRDRRQVKRTRAKAEAAAIAKANAISRPATSQTTYQAGGRPSADPFADGNRVS